MFPDFDAFFKSDKGPSKKKFRVDTDKDRDVASIIRLNEAISGQADRVKEKKLTENLAEDLDLGSKILKD